MKSRQKLRSTYRELNYKASAMLSDQEIRGNLKILCVAGAIIVRCEIDCLEDPDEYKIAEAMIKLTKLRALVSNSKREELSGEFVSEVLDLCIRSYKKGIVPKGVLILGSQEDSLEEAERLYKAVDGKEVDLHE